jgi:hypothetical protein
MIMDDYAIDMREEVMMVMKVKWWVMDDVGVVMEIILEWLVQCCQVHCEWNPW